jgi:hypothetical protein
MNYPSERDEERGVVRKYLANNFVGNVRDVKPSRNR